MAQITLNSSGVASSGSLLLQTNGTTTQATVDTSGNLGLGVTPSAWGLSGQKVFQVLNASLTAYTADEATVSGNAYYNGGWKYINSTYAEQYTQQSGQHRWYTAPSGTAGNAITFTQAMTLDANGNLGVGSTTPSSTGVDTGSAKIFSVAPNSNFGPALTLVGDGFGRTIRIADQGKTVIGLFDASSGDSAINFGTNSNHAIRLLTNGTERARIDSSGNLLLGATSQTGSAKLSVGGNSSTSRVVPNTDNVGYVGDSGARWQAIYAVNGTIQTSDGREKNTIQDSNLGLSFVQALRPVSYKWNVGENIVTYDENNQPVVTPRAGVRTHYGFIAQEVQAAIPSGVDFGGFVQEPNDGPMSLRYHEFIGPLVKAIQELKAEFDAYKAAPPNKD